MTRKNIVRIPTNQPPPTDRKFVTALARGLQILGEFENDTELGNQDLAQRTELPRATVTRLTYTLTSLGYLRQMPNGRYCAGVGFLGLSASIQRKLGVQRVARPFMETLARELDCTVVMAMRDRMSMVFLEVARPVNTGLTVNTDAGSPVPIHNTAVGMAWLMAAPLAEREEVLASLRDECADEWDATRRAIEQAHQAWRKQGFVVRMRSWHRDVNAVATTLKVDSMQKNVYAFFCAGPSRSLTRRLLDELYGPRLKTMVSEIKTRMETDRPAKLVVPPHPH